MNQPDISTQQGVSLIMLKPDSVLLIRRAKSPFHGYWSFPGGSVEPAETCEEAVIRELYEETALTVAQPVPVGAHRFDRAGNGGGAFKLHVFTALWQGGEPVAGDDADAALFFRFGELAGLKTTPRAEHWLDRARALFD